MSRIKFIILICLSVVVSLALILQLIMARIAASDENRLRVTAEGLQSGQVSYNQLQQIANWTAQVAAQKNDQTLRDLLTRNNIQIKPNTAPAPAPAPAATGNAPAAH